MECQQKLIYQPSITINHNWVKTFDVLKYGIELVRSNSPKITREYKYSDYGYHYEFGTAGNVSHVTNGSEYWYVMSGKLIESTMPWAKTLLETVKDLNPTFISINRMVGAGAKHKDQAGQLVGLNHFINTTNSRTYVYDGDYEESYPSIAGETWLIDIQKQHQIKNTKERTWFNLRFNAPFDECREWFIAHPNLVFGQG